MTLTVFCILLFAALLHASWNAIVKASGDKMYAAIGVSGSAALIALVMLPFAPQPALVSAPYLLASCALQVVYTVLVAKTYQVSDMSQTYPLMRGTAPLLVAAISVLFLGDRLSPLAWLGIGVICLALWAMTQAPLAVVAALRETSILFGALIAFIVLKEQLMPLRIVAACGIAAGAILLRLA
ncbi:TPA: hypothetical protein L7649_001946 [Klebsiella pneumoniae subsp. pneumoniae]|nr:hypothetical protein [Klebsiella pneumoniae subsp. pneumoniae]